MNIETKQLPVLENPEEVQNIINSLSNSVGHLKEAEEDLWMMFSCTLHEEGDTQVNTRRAWLYHNLVFHLRELYRFKQ